MKNPYEGHLLQPDQELNDLQEFVWEANEANERSWKIKALRNNEHCKAMWWWVYNPMVTFGITSEQVKKKYNPVKTYLTEQLSIHSLLSDLADRKLTGYAALDKVNKFISFNPDHAELIFNIIDRNLKTRTGAKLINSVYPGLIPTFNVALANRFEDFEKRIDWQSDTWYASRKLDGIRTLIFMKNKGKDIRFFSRSGKEFFSLNKLKDELSVKWLNCPDMVMDGEICIVDDKGNEHFQSILKELRTHNHTIERPKFKIFDLLTLNAFEIGFSNAMLHTRYSGISGLFELHSYNYMEKVDQIPIRDPNLFAEMREKAREEGWEGIMLRKDTYYQGKRSNDLLKAKFYKEADYRILGIKSGPIRKIVSGKDTTEIMMSAVTIRHKGNFVQVGSGFSMEERKEYYEDPCLIIGALITVKYFEETINEEGLHSLRFPVVKKIFKSGRKDKQ